MTNARLRKIGKERAIEIEESGEYQDARDEAFDKELKDMLDDIYPAIVTEDDVKGLLDSFEFPNESDWVASKVESEYGDYMDQAYEQMRDERIGI